ncbi:AMP-binding protein [Candidatus Babela massiliensis]|uniref:Acyl-CoA synthetase/AMP-acid ligase II n=1 Tax=Candidatus Babela massiliensis TaxID=673862 RepID=V6DFN5_9BACT|nr:AMP-binding protein [Candidatus Babela massiliensis]CDK30354.1 Acyl-CoA synthetase/AMP-acid ligase II [Candidatus Babela massiliensis]
MIEKLRYEKLYDSLNQDNKLIHVGLLLERAFKNWPENIAVIADDQSITYQELYYQANLFAKKLLGLGIKKGDRVIILYPNSIDFYIAYFGLWVIGAIAIPLNTFLIEKEVLKIIEDAEPHCLIIPNDFLDKFKELNNLDIAIVSRVFEKDILSIDNVITPANRDIEDIAAILYTSGTTGFPKGVMLTSKNIIINAIQGISRFESSYKDRIFCPLPLFHALPQNTCVWATTIMGATAITISRIDRHAILNGLKHNPTVIMAVPAIYGLFCKMKSIDFGYIRYFFSGGDVLSDKIRGYFELIYRRKLCNGYGLTETSPFISVDIDDYTQSTNNIGYLFFGLECQIRDSNMNILDKNQVGILWLKGDNIMKGYYNLPELTQEVLKDGWFNTGDLAYINQDGKIVLSGREKDLIKSKGIKIYPQEIENILLTHDKVIQAAVIGKKSSDMDEEYPVAYIASHTPDQEKLKKELSELARKNLAAYKLPKNFIIKRELPLTSTGKVDKKRLKSEL